MQELARSIYNHIADSMRQGNQNNDSPIILLGIEYSSISDSEFLNDWRTRPWISYRKDFPPIRPSDLTSDTGWGCMIRSGQMLLAVYLLSITK